MAEEAFTRVGWTTADPLYLIKDDRGIAEALASRFLSVGIKTEVTDHLPETALHAICLGSLVSMNKLGHAQIVALNTEAFNVARIIGKNLIQQQGTFILAFDSGLGEYFPGQAWGAGISALAKTAAVEWPMADVRSIDITTTDLTVEQISSRLFHAITSAGDVTELVVNQHGDHLRFVTDTAAVTKRNRSFKEGDTLLVSGGAKGVTAACLMELASRLKLNFGILGRSVLTEEADYLAGFSSEADLRKAIIDEYIQQGKKILPVELSKIVSDTLGQREIKKSIAQLKSSGSNILYIPIDVANIDEVIAATDHIRSQFGPISGLIHAAGVLADKLIHEKTDQQFSSVFTTKITGFANLLTATKNDPLTHICCFSSVAARMGNRGQVDYAMANEVLNKVCRDEQRHRGESCVVKSINWGPWDGGMVSPQLKKHFEEMGIALIPLQGGARIFAEEMEDGSILDVETVVGGLLSAWNVEGNSEEKKAAVWVHQSNHPFLGDHVIEGRIVVPLMMVSDWCMRLAKKNCPEFKNAVVTDMSVYQGIILENYSTTGDMISFNYTIAHQDENAVIHVRILGKDERPLYAARLILNNEFPVPLIHVLPHLEDWKWKKQDIYPSKLFHGETFRVIDRLEGYAPDACSAKLLLPTKSSGNAISKMLLFDGGIQVAILAMAELTGNSSALPLGFKSLTIYAEEVAELLTCELLLTSSGNAHAEWNVRYKDANNRIVADLQGLKMFMYK